MSYKEVNFDEWCEKCEYFKLAEEDEPCCDCLCIFTREDSHRPEFFKEKIAKTTKRITK